MKRIHVATVGRQLDAHNTTVDFSEAVLRASAEAYDPALHEAPIVVGHPRTDAPAYGWVANLEFSESGLEAIPQQVNVEFSEMVQAGSFKKKSAAFYPPSHPRNPVPGVYYLKHVGFLGAEPPAIKGLRDVQFSEDDSADLVEVEFAETSDWTLQMLFSRLRDYLIEKEGAERAERILPAYALEEMQMMAMRPMSEAEAPMPTFTESDMPTTPEELERREQAIAARELMAARREAVAFAEGLVSDGRLHPAQKERVTELLIHLDGPYIDLEFSEGGAEVKDKPVEIFKGLLSAMPKLVEFGEVAKGRVPTERTAAEIAADASSYQAEQAAKGIIVSAAEAVRHVQG